MNMATGQQLGQQAAATPAFTSRIPEPAVQPTASEQILSNLIANNERLGQHMNDLRSFLNRAVGEEPPGLPPTADTVAKQSGSLITITELLDGQAHMLEELRTIILAIEKLA